HSTVTWSPTKTVSALGSFAATGVMISMSGAAKSTAAWPAVPAVPAAFPAPPVPPAPARPPVPPTPAPAAPGRFPVADDPPFPLAGRKLPGLSLPHAASNATQHPIPAPSTHRRLIFAAISLTQTAPI